MTSQHIIGVQSCVEGERPEGIIVPLDLPELKLLKQEVQADGSIEVHVIARRTREACPRCRNIGVKVHDTRMRVKRDIRLRNYQVRLVLYTRRFRCLACKRSFTQTDTMCGRYKRTTKRLREHLAKQALQQPIAHVAEAKTVLAKLRRPWYAGGTITPSSIIAANVLERKEEREVTDEQ